MLVLVPITRILYIWGKRGIARNFSKFKCGKSVMVVVLATPIFNQGIGGEKTKLASGAPFIIFYELEQSKHHPKITKIPSSSLVLLWRLRKIPSSNLYRGLGLQKFLLPLRCNQISILSIRSLTKCSTSSSKLQARVLNGHI